MLIVGMSGAGKTALLMKMLLDPNLLNYEKLYYCYYLLSVRRVTEVCSCKMNNITTRDCVG